MVMKNVTKKIQKIPYLFLLMLFSFVTASAQKGITVRGTVLDSNGETIIGASVVLTDTAWRQTSPGTDCLPESRIRCISAVCGTNA